MTVNLSGWHISDNKSSDDITCHTITNCSLESNDTYFLIIGRDTNITDVTDETIHYFFVDDKSIGSGLNNNGMENVTFYNSSYASSMTYSGSTDGKSWSLCNGTWIETVNATPGMPNECPVQVNESSNETQNVTDENATESYDFSGISVDASDSESPVRFGDFARVKVVLHTGGKYVPLRIIAYIYSPHWITVDSERNTIHYYLNDTDAVLEIKTMENVSDLLLYLPLLIKENCDGDYENGVYKGNVRVYEPGTNYIVSEDRFNISIEGNNNAFCTKCKACPKCKKCDCSCSGSESGSENSGSGIMKLLGFAESAEAGKPFETTLNVKNTGSKNKSFAIYSYGYDGSRCLTYGLSSGKWSKGWTANEQSFSLEPGSSEQIILRNAFANETVPGVYSFRIRLKHDNKQDDITRYMRVEAAKEVPKVNKSGQDIEIIFEDAENKTMNTSDGITGMAATGNRKVTGLRTIYDYFLKWLASIFKF